MTKSSLPFPPQLALLFGILAVSTASIFIRYSQNYATSLVVAAYRLLIAALILAPIAFTTRREELTGLKNRELRLSLLSGLFLALHFATWITSLEYTTVASSVVLVSTTPLWVALLSPIFLKEPVTRKMLLGMGMALIGGVVIGISDTCIVSENGLVCPDAAEFVRGEAFLGDVLALIGAIMAAGYLIAGRKLRNQISNTCYVFIVYSMAAVILVIVVLLSGNSLIGYPREAYLWFLLLAIIPQLMGHSTFNWALGYLSAAYVSISMLGEPIGSTILAYIVLDETPTIFMIFGAILIMAGIYLASLGEQKIQNQ
ncbi:MAG: DMT family transporter [Chloroflexota bacterium]|nr:DMT family transporter [Chloroflexota bacterium]